MPDYGYAGSILRVDLSSGNVQVASTVDYSERFLGGRGIGAKVHWDEVPPEIGALDEQNRLTFAVGPMAGVHGIGASRWGVFGKSPLDRPEKFAYANLGGRWGAQLKFAGYDALVINGKSEKPVYLLINDGKAELRDASNIWGKGAAKTREALKSELGKNYSVVTIGPAGENLVPISIMLADNDSTGSGGLGAVMGSKMLKAIAVKGEQRKVKVAKPDKIKEIADLIREMHRDNMPMWGMDFKAHGPNTRKEPCYGCLGNCPRVRYTAQDGTSGKFMCHSRWFYLGWSWGYYGEENDVPFFVNRLCDDYGVDTWELNILINWLHDCYQAGVISEGETGIPLSKIGSLEYMETLVRMISLREGFGGVLAQGRERAAEQLGSAAKSLIKHGEAREPRFYITTALIFPFEPRDAVGQIHEVGVPLAHWTSWVKGCEGTYMSPEVLSRLARDFWGSEAAADLTTYDGKALAAKLIQDREYSKECLMVCDMLVPLMDIPNTQDHAGDPLFESKMLSAVTGEEVDKLDLNSIGERVFNLQRAILLREGHVARQDDVLPEEWYTVPYPGHHVDPETLVPDKDGNPVSRIGAVVERNEYERIRDEYYQLRGWDEATGLQTRDTLNRLNLDDIVEEMQIRNLLA
ncbi:MAG: aldehyde ferredoxin oxidoreductase N-terminal domain-containing protein [Dehalococcoidia bacterium]